MKGKSTSGNGEDDASQPTTRQSARQRVPSVKAKMSAEIQSEKKIIVGQEESVTAANKLKKTKKTEERKQLAKEIISNYGRSSLSSTLSSTLSSANVCDADDGTSSETDKTKCTMGETKEKVY